MKLHIVSDLHLEFGRWPRQVDVNGIEADVTVLAGDIGVGLEGLQWALRIERPVIYVMGNHEFYGRRPMDDLWRKAREKVRGSHIHLLENDSVLIDDPDTGARVRFLGATLWTDWNLLGAEEQEACMEHAASDYHAIHVSRRGRSLVESGYSAGHQGDRLTPRKTLAMHHESRGFLERELGRAPELLRCVDAWDKTVVVTHHAPSARSLPGQQVGARLDATYASDLDSLVAQANLWIHGHTHVAVDYPVGAGRVVSNPRGYVGQGLVREFDPGLVVEV